MRNVKLERNLEGDDYWPVIGVVNVDGNPEAKPIPADASQAEAEKIIQDWQKVAVLKVTPEVPVYFGFAAGAHVQYLNTPIETKGSQFGVHVGNGDVVFFVAAVDKQTRVNLAHVETANINDPKYATLPLY